MIPMLATLLKIIVGATILRNTTKRGITRNRSDQSAKTK